MYSVIIHRWIAQADLEAALQIIPAGMRVHVPHDMNLFAHDGIVVEWQCEFDEMPSGDEQSVASMSVTNALRVAGIEILQSSNGVSVPQAPGDDV